MTDRDLSSLKDLPVPAPRAEARKTALDAATQAFVGSTAGDAGEPQGNVVPLRPIRATSEREGRRRMRTRRAFAIAASLAGLAIAVPAALHVLGEARMQPLSGIDTDRIAEQRPLAAARSAPIGQPGVPGLALPAPSPAAPVAIAAAPAAPPAAVRPAPTVRQGGPATAAVESGPRKRPAEDGRAALGGSSLNEKSKQVAGAPGTALAERDRLSRTELEAALVGATVSARVRPASADEAARRVGIQKEIVALDAQVRRPDAESRDRFASAEPYPFRMVAQEPVSTFSVDVDTASYSLVRRWLNAGRLPPREAVRVEEMINYFGYDYARPESAGAPFRPAITVLATPWNAESRLVHIALKGYELRAAERPRANLVLLIDVSGSMGPQDRLPLLKRAFAMLVNELKPDDTVAIVSYASDTATRLASTRVAEKSRILDEIDALQAGGGTYGEGGLQRAYALAEAGFDKAAVNRVILATDGDFNIGISDRAELQRYIEGKRRTGIYLSVLGVGMGNHNDRLMQALAQNGNGVAAYIDTLNEARKVLVEEASQSLFPIAKDVKIQIEFNPAEVSAYRLIGYETRALRREDFNDDKVDAGDVGSGHAVTAIYEVMPRGAEAKLVDGLRYQPVAKPALVEPAAKVAPGAERELAFLELRYKLPGEDASRLVSLPVTVPRANTAVQEAPADVRFSIAVAAFGQLLKGSPHLGTYAFDDVIALANGAKGEDAFGLRAEFVNLVRMAKSARR